MSTDWGKFGFCRVSALLPKIELGKPLLNADKILSLLIRESKAGAQVVSAPELAITGYTCEDLFHSETLIRESERAIQKIVEGSKGTRAFGSSVDRCGCRMGGFSMGPS